MHWSARLLLRLGSFALVAASCRSAPAEQTAASPAPAPSSAEGQRQRGYTGMELQHSASFGANGNIIPGYPVVTRVAKGSPGERAGVAAGDVILEVNGRDARQPGANFYAVGERYVLRFRRGAVEHEGRLVPEAPRGNEP
jgi:S1-C subfamily serine protease